MWVGSKIGRDTGKTGEGGREPHDARRVGKKNRFARVTQRGRMRERQSDDPKIIALFGCLCFVLFSCRRYHNKNWLLNAFLETRLITM